MDSNPFKVGMHPPWEKIVAVRHTTGTLDSPQVKAWLPAERLRDHAVDHELQINMVVGQVDQIVGGEFRMEFFFEEQGIGKSGAEGDHRPRIPQDRIPHGFIDLGHVLMRKHQIEVIFAHFGKHTGEARSGKRRKLIYI
jgi:hypothetical protein